MAKLKTYSGWIEVNNPVCRAAAKRILETEQIPYDDAGSRFDVDGITADQYDLVIDALNRVGDPEDDWNFPLD